MTIDSKRPLVARRPRLPRARPRALDLPALTADRSWRAVVHAAGVRVETIG